ncbi:DNA polymerase III subunit alpha [Candidatus Vidania fulgoroideorum]
MIVDKIYTDFSFEKGCISYCEFCKITQSVKKKYILLDFYSLSGISEYYLLFRDDNLPIIGCEIFLKDSKDGYNFFGKVSVLINSNEGYLNLKHIINKSWFRYKKKGLLYSKFSDFKNQSGLIFLSGNGNGIYSNLENFSIDFLKKYTMCINKYILNFVIELQKFNDKLNVSFVSLVKLSKFVKNFVLFTHPIRFYQKNNFTDFINKYCIIKKEYYCNAVKKLHFYKNNFFVDREKVYNFSKEKKIYIKKKSINLKNKYNFINFFNKQKNLIKDSDKKLKKLIIKSAKKNNLFKSIKYRYRVLKEYSTIKEMGFSSHFLIVFDIVRWSKKKNILVGPGRGSGASSLISYIIGITDIDPIKHKLIFERFLNKKKKSIPDFDIDFCNNNRNRVLKYIRSKFGKKKILNIVTFSSFLIKNTIRDCTRILGYRFSLSTKILQEMEIRKINNIDEMIKNCSCSDTLKILIASKNLEGRIKGVGTHAGGVIIDSNFEIPFFTIDKKKGYFLTQFDKKFLEYLKIIKLDILGLNTLSILEKIGRKIGREINYRKLDLNNINVINSINKGDTIGIFQLEGIGIRKFIKKAIIKNFNDVVNIVSIYRPGPINLLSEFVIKKKKRKNVLIRSILNDTNGFIIFQEQVINIAKLLADFSLDESDVFRNSVSKNVDLNIYKNKFISGCRKKIGLECSKKLFNEIKEFCGYSFNKAHAVSYSYITFYMAFLKYNYKTQFYKCSLDLSVKNKFKIKNIYEDCILHNINILRPDINKSNFNFKIEEKSIRIGFCALKGFSEISSKKIIKERKKSGNFKSVFDLFNRIDRKFLKKNILEILFYSGALNSLEKTFEKCYEEVFFYIKNSNQNLPKGQMFIFKDLNKVEKKVNVVKRIRKENDILGINLKNIDYLLNSKINNLKKRPNEYSSFTGLLTEINFKKDNKYVLITLEKKLCVKKVFLIEKNIFLKKKFSKKDIIILFYNNFKKYYFLNIVLDALKIND